MSSSASKPTFIVGIGASAGGLKPIEEFFDNMPVDSGMAFVVVQHLSPDFKSLMDELLARHTKMNIHKVTNGVKIESNSIYLIPPEKNMDLADGTLLLSDKERQRSLNLPIDIFLRSLANDAGERAIAIILSGTGSDGSRGIKNVRESGGLVLVQKPDTAGFDGMPQAAISSGVVDLICAPQEMPARIVSYAKDLDRVALQQNEFNSEIENSEENAMNRIFRLFRHRHNVDFSLYKPATIVRRLERRVHLSKFENSIDYVSFVENDYEESEVLFRDLLVEVTQFFRDPEAFEQLRNVAIPKLLLDNKSESELRVWICGCATGEEAYSVAMCLAEGIENAQSNQAYKVFATDVHRTSLEIASNGIYSLHALDNVPTTLQNKYFTKKDDVCHIKRQIRQSVIFAANDVTRDPPFTRLDMIVCRNVLIYFKPEVQRRVLSMFHFGLKVGGLLFLGPSETVFDLAKEFDRLDRHWRIYTKTRDVRLPEATRIPMRAPSMANVVNDSTSAVAANSRNLSKQVWLTAAYEDLLSRHVPPSLMVDERNELVHCFGNARKLLSPPEGKPSNDILKMLDSELSNAVNMALHRARKEAKPVVYRGVRVAHEDGAVKLFRVSVEPYRKSDRSMYLIMLERLDDQDTEAVATNTLEFQADSHGSERMSLLERELNYTRETLQATVEELESSNEELQATNEELVASNEELQSTNEELHSVNEELFTVNTEHKEKIEELTELTSDMDNLLRSTEIGTIFLDKALNIRMFTPSISAGFNVLDQDIGRPIDHIAYKLDSPNLLQDVAEVLKTELPKEINVTGRDGRYYLQRIQPYRNGDRTEGIVLTLTDVTAMRESEHAKEAMSTLLKVNEELPAFAYAVSHDFQAPLRHIAHYTELLETAVENESMVDAAKASRVIAQSSSKLRAMIEAMLSYSRVNTLGGTLTPSSLNAAIDSALDDLRESISVNEAEVTIDKNLPEVMGDLPQLTTLFRHVIENAIKYRDGRPLKIGICGFRSEDKVTIEICDNGIGMEPRFHEDVFTIFKRVVRKEMIPGAGVGLAICRRICLRHFGNIELKSTVGEGTKVLITLPLPKDSRYDLVELKGPEENSNAPESA